MRIFKAQKSRDVFIQRCLKDSELALERGVAPPHYLQGTVFLVLNPPLLPLTYTYA